LNSRLVYFLRKEATEMEVTEKDAAEKEATKEDEEDQ
jgi:hypothetical protein